MNKKLNLDGTVSEVVVESVTGTTPVTEEQQPVTAPKSPSEQAATSFGLYYPLFVNIVTRLSAKSARRLLVSLMGIPFKNPTVNLKTPDEKMALEMGMHLDQAKVIMMLDGLFKHTKALNEATDPNAKISLDETPNDGTLTTEPNNDGELNG